MGETDKTGLVREARRAVKHSLAVAWKHAGTLSLVRRGVRWARRRSPRVRIFGYHHVVTDVRQAAAINMPPLCTSTTMFSAHLDHLMRSYEVLPLDVAVDVLAGRRPAPARDIAVITFDDGYRDVLEHAAPILHERRLPAALFVTTSVVGTGRPLAHDRVYALARRALRARRRLLGAAVPDRLLWPLARADKALFSGDAMAAADAILSALPMADVVRVADAMAARLGEPTEAELAPCLGWAELGRLSEMGFSIGAHTISHAHLPLEDSAALEAELLEPMHEIARQLGRKPDSLAYPAGRYDTRVLAAARRAGYSSALTTEDRANPLGSDPLCLGRKVLSEDHGLGIGGAPSPDLAAAQLDGLFTALGLSRAIRGDQPVEAPWA